MTCTERHKKKKEPVRHADKGEDEMVTMMVAITMITDDHRDSNNDVDDDRNFYGGVWGGGVITTTKGISDEYGDVINVNDR